MSHRSHASLDSQCRLLSLPPELRNLIYYFTLTCFDHINLAAGQGFAMHKQLLNTCRQIRSEATAVFYKENRFVVQFGERYLRNAIKILALVGPSNVSNIKTIEIRGLALHRYRYVLPSRLREVGVRPESIRLVQQKVLVTWCSRKLRSSSTT